MRASGRGSRSQRRIVPTGHHDRRRPWPHGGGQPRGVRCRREVGGIEYRTAHEQYPNPYVTPDLCFRFHYFALRKLHLLLRAKALVAFPGGYGTFDELFEVLTLVQTRKIKPIPVILVGEQFWRRAVDFDYLVEEGVIDLEDRELFWFAETAQDIWNGILAWYAAAGEPLDVGR
ncbi:MAG: LOG family protein [Xanthobacteraceae bacterium]